MPNSSMTAPQNARGSVHTSRDQGLSWDNKVTAKAVEVRPDPLEGRDQVSKARTSPRVWEGSAVPGFLGTV